MVFFKHFRYQEGNDTTSDVRNVLLVVAALVAAVTFQAGVNPPGGVWQDDSNGHNAGRAIYGASKQAFYVFLIFNTLALSTSILILISLTFKFPFHFEILVATTSMIITYGSAVFAVTPEESVRFRYILLASAVPFVVRFLIEMFKNFRKLASALAIPDSERASLGAIASEKKMGEIAENTRRGGCFRFRYEEERDSPKETRNVLLIVATLTAAVTFQAGVNPPGGVWQDNTAGHKAGRAIYSSQRQPFYAFLIFNTIALSTSILVIMSLTYRFPFFFEIWIATASMFATYASALFAIAPDEEIKFRYVLLAAAVPFLYQMLKKFCR
ncbi:hypothetical protein F0562_018562 [Nyssa sinensis]|uniref:PGG domain-containing protein n=1 Tax=Nyssa sinensis TaxID=561372 RepID=A0A5J4ZEX2_9ASTE|nr:hypothetical protein F0562_018562 [Nyssa sinensis]